MLYLQGIRILMFRLSDFYYRVSYTVPRHPILVGKVPIVLDHRTTSPTEAILRMDRTCSGFSCPVLSSTIKSLCRPKTSGSTRKQDNDARVGIIP